MKQSKSKREIDEYLDPSRRVYYERKLETEKNISHLPFQTSTPLFPEQGFFGGWNGCFSKVQGVQIGSGEVEHKREVYMQPYTMKMGKANNLGPEFPHVADGNFVQFEKMNQRMKLGNNEGFRDFAHGAKPFLATNTSNSVFDTDIFRTEPGMVEAVTKKSKKNISKAAQLAKRADHGGRPFNSSASARTRPTELFSRYETMPEPFVTNPTKVLEKSVRAKVLPSIVNPPFVPTATVKDTLPSASIMFYKEARKQH